MGKRVPSEESSNQRAENLRANFALWSMFSRFGLSGASDSVNNSCRDLWDHRPTRVSAVFPFFSALRSGESAHAGACFLRARQPASRLPRLKDPRSARAFPLDAARCRHGGFPPRDGGRPGGLREGPPGGRLQHLRQVRRAARSPHPPRARPPALPPDGDAPTGLERATESPCASRGASPRVASSGRRALTSLLDVVFPNETPPRRAATSAARRRSRA